MTQEDGSSRVIMGSDDGMDVFVETQEAQETREDTKKRHKDKEGPVMMINTVMTGLSALACSTALLEGSQKLGWFVESQPAPRLSLRLHLSRLCSCASVRFIWAGAVNGWTGVPTARRGRFSTPSSNPARKTPPFHFQVTHSTIFPPLPAKTSGLAPVARRQTPAFPNSIKSPSGIKPRSVKSGTY